MERAIVGQNGCRDQEKGMLYNCRVGVFCGSLINGFLFLSFVCIIKFLFSQPISETEVEKKKHLQPHFLHNQLKPINHCNCILNTNNPNFTIQNTEARKRKNFAPKKK